MCRYTTLRNVSVLKQKLKTTCVTTNCRKLTTRNNAFIVSVIVQNNCHILQLSSYETCCTVCTTLDGNGHTAPRPNVLNTELYTPPTYDH